VDLTETLRVIRESESEALDCSDLRERLDSYASEVKLDIAAEDARDVVPVLQNGRASERQFARLLLREAPIRELLIGELIVRGGEVCGTRKSNGQFRTSFSR
jgi:hypothetical protein